MEEPAREFPPGRRELGTDHPVGHAVQHFAEIRDEIGLGDQAADQPALPQVHPVVKERRGIVADFPPQHVDGEAVLGPVVRCAGAAFGDVQEEVLNPIE
ncbi:hypothetical protein STAQ_48840 [Allostella sp. ATCC 35155]|nr:hypothetical protein STAQ_48840 [Stella sp. ATCC 35155]